MTLQDYQLPFLKGYYKNSLCPAEVGGPRLQKYARTPGLNIQPHETLGAVTRQLSREKWVVGNIEAENRMFTFGACIPIQSAHSFGWLEQIDPISLDPIKSSPNLKSGGHNWCNCTAIIADGSIILGNGRYVHKLNLDLEIIGELELPTDHAHNGFTILSDGMGITRNLEVNQSKNSWFTVFDPASMKVVQHFEFVGSSIGRFSVDEIDGVEYIYATTATHIHRLIYKNQQLSLDEDWSASYDLPGEDQSFAWCNCLGDDSVWFHDMGDNGPSQVIMSTYPVGSKDLDLRKTKRTIHHAPVRVFRVSTKDSSDMDVLTPFGDKGGEIGAPPLYVPDKKILVAFDTLNGKTGAWPYEGPGQFSKLWEHKIRNSNQILYYPDTGEAILDDRSDNYKVDAVVVDIETRTEKARCNTGTRISANMLWGEGYHRDAYMGGGLAGSLVRIFVKEK
jgi:hypothetical protein